MLIAHEMAHNITVGESLGESHIGIQYILGKGTPEGVNKINSLCNEI